MTCEKCSKELTVGEWPFCPHGYGSFTHIPDEIPGGVDIKHGLCNEDGTPRRYFSRSEIAAEAKRRGLVNYVRHVGTKGGDKNPHTTRWI